ncbi:MAG: hypothetical protein RMM17_03065 [Acidobacteriota bacterium]|nr:hypothetical protein [Blastocatellia bacterium]MDW8411649.1 hypothetical protein [Acidobacteriota bacterium]
MKIDNRFNIPNIETYTADNTHGVDRANFQATLDAVAEKADLKTVSPLRSALTSIVKSVDMNNSVMSRVAIDKAARAIVSNLVGPEVRSRIDMETMLDTISDFAQNDPILSRRLRGILERLA